jgi:stress responsive alpha/beta barrel protein
MGVVMIRHVVVFEFDPGLPAGQVGRITAALDELARRLPMLREYHYGPDLGLPAGNGDYAITALVDDQAAFESYLDDAEHRRVAAELIDPYVRVDIAVQLEVR